MAKVDALVLLVWLAGCHSCDTVTKDPPPRVVSADAIAEASAAQASEPALPQPDAGSACDRLRDREGLTADADRGWKEDDWISARFACDRATQSGWAVRWDPELDGGASATFTVLHDDGSGSVVRWSTKAPPKERPLWPPSLEVHDYDGDGVPELFSGLQYGGGAREWVRARAFVTFKNGRITPYSPASGLPIDHLEDVDHDGRPDLVVEYDVGHGHRCDLHIDGAGGPDLVTLVAHGLPDGTFSMSDAVARSELAKREKCTTAPAHIVTISPTIDGGEPPSIVEEDIVCARMWGTAKDVILNEVETVCAPYASQTSGCTGPCRYIEDVRQLARFDPPITLK